MQQYLILILIFVFLMSNDVKHIFMCLFAICMSSSVKCLCLSSVHFIIRLFFLLLHFESSVHILDNNPLSDNVVCEYILSICNLSFHPLHLNFYREKVFNFDLSNLSIFSFMDCLSPFRLLEHNTTD